MAINQEDADLKTPDQQYPVLNDIELGEVNHDENGQPTNRQLINKEQSNE